MDGSPRKRTRSEASDEVHSSSSKVHGVVGVSRRLKKAKGGNTGDLSRTKTSNSGVSDGVAMVCRQNAAIGGDTVKI